MTSSKQFLARSLGSNRVFLLALLRFQRLQRVNQSLKTTKS